MFRTPSGPTYFGQLRPNSKLVRLLKLDLRKTAEGRAAGAAEIRLTGIRGCRSAPL